MATYSIDGITHAIISLSALGNQINDLGESVDILETRMYNAEANIAVALSKATEAHKLSGEIDKSNANTVQKVEGALGKLDEVIDSVGSLESFVASTNKIAVEAQAFANNAINSAATMKNDAVEAANKALESVVALRDDFDAMGEGIHEIENQISIITTENSEQGTAIAGIRIEVDDYSAKLDDLVAWQGETNTAMARIEQKADSNGAYIQSTVFNMDKYSVGPYSQAQGFTLDQAKAILEKGMVYVPTVTHSNETYNINYNFTKNNIYTWSGETWMETIGKVVFADTAPSGTVYPLWYKDGDTVSDGYEPYTLYKLNEVDEWIPVATLVGNSQSRAISQIRQDTNSIAAEVTDARENVASLSLRLTNTESEVQSLALWSKGGNEDGEQYNLATIKQNASEASASISQVVEAVGKDGNVTAASIVTAVNNDTSGVTINADHLNFDGKSFNLAISEPINNAINNVEIGSRNLLPDTDFDGESKRYEILPGKPSEGGFRFDPTVQIESGIDYTLSVKIRGKSDVVFYELNEGTNVSHLWIAKENLSEDEYKSFSITFNVKASNKFQKVYICTRWSVSTEGDWFEIAPNSLKLEKGNKATDWTPAPEDTVNKKSVIASINASKEGITIDADKINIKGSVTFEALDTSVQTSINNSIASTIIEYALSKFSDNFEAVSGTAGQWSTTAPQWQEGSYMWQRTTIKYTGTKADTVTTTCIQGAKGEQGIQGNDGKTPVKGVDYFDGKDGKDGYTPVKGVDYSDGTDGQDGKDGTSIVWKGSFDTAPTNPQNGWAYYDETQHASYTYQNGWYQMSVDGVDGQDGTDGQSIVWKGESSTAPQSPVKNWVYRDIDDGKVYIYNGTGWELMVLDGSDGADGTNGSDGLSVFITYNDSTTTPNTPTGNGTENGWHTAATSTSVWMSQKVASAASEGTWGTPIKIKGEDGADGKNGTSGVSVTGVVTRYYIARGNSSSDKPDNGLSEDKGWFDDFDLTMNRYWQLKEEEPGTYYIWSQEKVTYSDGSVSYTDATVNSANSAIASWCVNNDVTKINGGHIATGSITAAQIATDALKSTDYDSGNADSDIPTSPGFTTKGTFFDLATGAIYSKNFCITDGSASFNGDISGSSGTFKGDISAATGTFTGDLSGADISGGTININNNFEVDSDGNVTLKGDIIWGEGKGISEVDGEIYIYAGKIEGNGISIDLNEGTINCENGGNKFELDEAGLAFSGDIFINGATFYENRSVEFIGNSTFKSLAKFNAGVEITGGLTVDSLDFDEVEVETLTVGGVATIDNNLIVLNNIEGAKDLILAGTLRLPQGAVSVDGTGYLYIQNYGG